MSANVTIKTVLKFTFHNKCSKCQPFADNNMQALDATA